MQGGWAIGYILAAIVAGTILPWLGWRVLFFIGIAPALFTAWIRTKVEEPEIWVKSNKEKKQGFSLTQIFHRDLIRYTVCCTIIVCFVMFGYWELFTWLPGFLSSPAENPAVWPTGRCSTPARSPDREPAGARCAPPRRRRPRPRRLHGALEPGVGGDPPGVLAGLPHRLLGVGVQPLPIGGPGTRIACHSRFPNPGSGTGTNVSRSASVASHSSGTSASTLIRARVSSPRLVSCVVPATSADGDCWCR